MEISTILLGIALFAGIVLGALILAMALVTAGYWLIMHLIHKGVK